MEMVHVSVVSGERGGKRRENAVSWSKDHFPAVRHRERDSFRMDTTQGRTLFVEFVKFVGASPEVRRTLKKAKRKEQGRAEQ